MIQLILGEPKSVMGSGTAGGHSRDSATPLINSSGAALLHYRLFIVTIIRRPPPAARPTA